MEGRSGHMKQLLIFGIVLILFASLGLGAVNDAEQWFTFDDADLTGSDPDDVSGNGNNGVNSGAATGETGILNQAFRCVTPDYINTTMTASSGSSYAVTYWFKGSAGSSGYTFNVEQSAGGVVRMKHFFYTDRDILYSVNGDSDRTVPTHNYGAWNHIIHTCDGSNCYSYHNGTLIATQGQTGSFNDITSAAYLCAEPSLASKYSDGYIDEFGLYFHNLTEADVSDLWNSGAGSNPYETGPDTLNITSTVPANNTQFNTGDTGDLNFNASVNSSFGLECSLYINDTLNQSSSFPTKYRNLSTPNILSWWTLDGNTNDIIGGNNGVANGSVSSSDGFNGSYEFDGTDDFIDINSLNTPRNTNKTISLWAYSGADDAQFRRMFYQQTFAGANHLSLLFWSDDQVNSYMGADVCDSGFDPSDNAWHHYVLTTDDTNQTIYVDGDLKKSCSGTAKNSNINIAKIGSSSTTQFWKGNIDEVKIINRTLTADEIVEEYNNYVNNTYEFNFDVTFPENDEGEYNYYFQCDNAVTEENSTTNTFYIDNVDPAITWTYPASTNDTILDINSNSTLTANIALQDWSLYSYYYNISSGGSVIYNFSNTSLSSIATYTISDSVDLENYTGELEALVRVCDGHTANNINFDAVVNGKELVFNDGKIKVYPDNPNTVNLAGFNREPDRYTFDFTTKNPMVVQTFWVTSDDYIDILQDSKYAGHLVSGDHWVDFEINDLKNVIVNRVSDNAVKVIVTLNSPKQYWHFRSIGELNCVQETVNFYITNSTTTAESELVETEVGSYLLKIDYGVLNVTSVGATLTWNGTAYSPTQTNGSNYFNFTVNITHGLVDVLSTNVTYNWNYTLNGDSFNLSSNNQTIWQMFIDNCTLGSTQTINFTLKNESNDAEVTGNIKTWFNTWKRTQTLYRNFSINFTSGSSYGVCIYPSTVNFTVDMEAEYSATGFATKLYYISDTIISSVTKLVNLFFTDGTTQVKFIVVDKTDTEVSGVDIKILSYDVGTGTSKITEVVQTNDEGEAFAQIILNNQDYQFILERDGVILLETGTTRITTTSKKFRVDLEEDYFSRYNIINGITYSPIVFTNSTLTFSYTYNDPSSSISDGCLKVVRLGATSDVEINDYCNPSTAGTVSVNITEAVGSNSYLATSYVKFSDDQVFHLDSYSVSFDEGYKTFGLEGIFVTFLIMITLVLATLFSPMVGIIMSVLAITVAVILNVFFLSWPIIVSLIIVAGVVLYKLNK